jgi:anti-anti-sigma factor
MQLTILREDAELVLIGCEGEIVQDDFRDLINPLITLIGPDVFTRKILLDLTGTTFVGSSGIGWLVSCHNQCRKQGGYLVVHSIPSRISNVFLLLKMDEVLHLDKDEESAVQQARGVLPPTLPR